MEGQLELACVRERELREEVEQLREEKGDLEDTLQAKKEEANQQVQRQDSGTKLLVRIPLF